MEVKCVVPVRGDTGRYMKYNIRTADKDVDCTKQRSS